MGEYATESPTSVLARRKRRRSLITLAVVVLGLFFAFWYALSYYRADAGPAADPSTTAACTPFDPDAARIETTTVNVYNATNRTGLAGSTAKDLEELGFGVDEVANDPTNRDTPAVAEVRHGPKGEAQAALVLSAMPEDTVLVNDKRKGNVVDVALGTGFTAVVTPTPSGPPMCPDPSASPSESATS
ncbi:MAG: LytR C-terminal domain-containing protein [Ornithinibacter sp.]